MRRIFVIVLFFYLLMNANANEKSIVIRIYGMPDVKVYLVAVKGSEQNLIDSTFVFNGSAELSSLDSLQKGMYRIIFENSEKGNLFGKDPLSLPLFWLDEKLVMETDVSEPIKNMNIIGSEGNRTFYSFLNLRNNFYDKFRSLMTILNYYDRGDGFYPYLRDEIISSQKNYSDSLLIITAHDPEGFPGSYIRTFQVPVFDPAEWDSIEDFLKDNFFNYVMMNDPALIFSDAYSSKIMNYLSLYMDPGNTREEQEAEFIRAADVIMSQAGGNQEVYDFVLNFLIDSFERFQMENALVHIADNYLEGECETENEQILKERLEAFQKMAPGKKVKNIVLLDENDNPQRLNDIESKYILVVFWSTNCPHCTSLLPRLKNWCEKEKNELDLSVYAVSIDSSRVRWEDYIIMESLPWTNVYDPEGWESKTSRQYNIYATPTMILIDRERSIISKPMTFRALKRDVGKLE